ncbi:MAG: hypothetical protein Q4B54_11810 [Coriobacteriales bacterium]|nr:hypothetical protein [Coriobacteriales bacterium]
MKLGWEDGHEITISSNGEATRILANREGMISLAHILTDLAEQKPGTHAHLDEYNSLMHGTHEIIIERAD